MNEGNSEISLSHREDYEDGCLMGCCAAKYRKFFTDVPEELSSAMLRRVGS
jgi:hypothetical protein